MDSSPVVGGPARVVGRKHCQLPGLTMDQPLDEPYYLI